MAILHDSKTGKDTEISNEEMNEKLRNELIGLKVTDYAVDDRGLLLEFDNRILLIIPVGTKLAWMKRKAS